MLTRKLYAPLKFLVLILLASTPILATEKKKSILVFFYNIQKDSTWSRVESPKNAHFYIKLNYDCSLTEEKLKQMIVQRITDFPKNKNFDHFLTILYNSHGNGGKIQDSWRGTFETLKKIKDSSISISIGQDYQEGSLACADERASSSIKFIKCEDQGTEHQDKKETSVAETKEPKHSPDKAPKNNFNMKSAGVALIGLAIVGCSLWAVTSSTKDKKRKSSK